ncbi:hypothetical protein T459_28395 [Capsicum annuum]|uniref:Short-chain dehydrogenase/reductase 2b-like n=1 Tax=Capsicum annuum TaxID=4072 RepID=A0A2G2YGM6_CAPAN|nr:hypothetical protein T459_28395 [Capsicum annuum]
MLVGMQWLQEQTRELALRLSNSSQIQVNHAGASGVVVDEDVLRALNVDPEDWLAGKAVNVIQVAMKTTYESAKLCLDTNYYGDKNVTEALLPLLQNSTSARIVNVSSLRSELKNETFNLFEVSRLSLVTEERRKEPGDIENLTEDKIDKILQKFLYDLKQDALEVNGWQMMLPAYSISKVSLNAYTRILARRYPKMCINCVHPGYVNTDINWHTGTMPVEEGAEGPVKLAVLPDGGPTGCYFRYNNNYTSVPNKLGSVAMEYNEVSGWISELRWCLVVVLVVEVMKEAKSKHLVLLFVHFTKHFFLE